MSMVQQTPDALLIVRDTVGGRTYTDTATNANLDYGVTTPALAPGAIDRVYDQNIRHVMTDGHNIIAVGPMPWAAGDTYISNIAAAITNQTNRRNSATLPPHPH